ncbi:MAG: NAD(P)-dependent oxidoreductase [Rhodospirillales bacterium]|nr:NAD(P)-dependent oxidoreductase [Rhodospirillales bacterium]
MAEPMLQFVSRPKRTPEKRAANERRNDFREIYGLCGPAEAAGQAGRCSQCGIPYCQIDCPLANDIPDWLMLAAGGRLEEAYRVSSATNNMPEICGRICPHDKLCEGSCVIESAGHGTVTIGAIEKHITDVAWDRGWVRPPLPRRELDRSVAIIGAGPGGLAAAEQLRRKGYSVDVYDRYDRIGGLLVYGIPGFKLEKHLVQRRADLLESAGIRFHLNADVGGQIAFADLRARFDAVLIAVGAYRAREIAVPGAQLEGVVPALDYLIASNRKGFGEPVAAFDSGALNADARNVVVIGGGDTAMDCVRTAVRQSTRSVTCLYRRDRANMPGSAREVAYAEEEGVEFAWLTAPEAFLGERAVAAVRAQAMRLGAPDAERRRAPVSADSPPFDIPADLVIKALGFDVDDVPTLFDVPDLELSEAGTLAVDWETMATNLDGVYAAGDIVRGASLVVWAIRDGRVAAEAIDRHIQAKAGAAAAAA